MAKFNRLLGSFVACAAMLGGISTPVFSNTLQTGSGYLMNAKSGVRSEFSQNFAGVFPRF